MMTALLFEVSVLANNVAAFLNYSSGNKEQSVMLHIPLNQYYPLLAHLEVMAAEYFTDSMYKCTC